MKEVDIGAKDGHVPRLKDQNQSTSIGEAGRRDNRAVFGLHCLFKDCMLKGEDFQNSRGLRCLHALPVKYSK